MFGHLCAFITLVIHILRYDLPCCVGSTGPAGTLSRKRLDILKLKFELHEAMNWGTLKKKDFYRDFFSVAFILFFLFFLCTYKW